MTVCRQVESARTKKYIAVLATIAMALVGCGKRSATEDTSQLTPEQTARIESEYVLPTELAPAPPADSSAVPQTGRPSARPQQPIVRPIQERLSGAIHSQLTVQLRMYVEKKGQMPGSFSEFVNSAMDSVPSAPDGMKFVIDPADRTVKVVRK